MPRSTDDRPEEHLSGPTPEHRPDADEPFDPLTFEVDEPPSLADLRPPFLPSATRSRSETVARPMAVVLLVLALTTVLLGIWALTTGDLPAPPPPTREGPPRGSGAEP